MRSLLVFVCALVLTECAVFGEKKSTQPFGVYPRVYFTKSDIPKLREKTEKVEWARKFLQDAHKSVDRLVNIHKENPSHIVSHLQMHWEEGKRHTRFFTQGNFIPRREGNAKYPTIRPPYARSWGDGIKSGDWQQDPPYSDGRLRARNPADSPTGDGLIPFERTGQAYENINDMFLRLAYNASIIYALEENEDYAKFAADIVWTLVRGGAQQEWVNPDEKGGVKGFLSWETLGDTRHYWALPLVWDILYDYYQQKYFETDEFRNGIAGELWAPGHPEGKTWALEQFHIFFEKMIDNKLQRGGGLIGNWNLNEHQSAMLYALALDDDSAYADGKGRQYYVKALVKGPTTPGHGAYMDVLRANIDPVSGLWPEAPGGYGQGSIAQLVKFGFIYWKGGLDLLARDPLLFKASRAMPQMTFPNGYITNIGDSSYHRIWTDQLELMAAYAEAKGDKDLLSRCAELIKLAGGRDLRSDIAFFFYLPELLDVTSPPLSRVSYASCYPVILERNPAKSEDAKDALAFSLAGFSTKMGHRHPNGLTLELYGRGEILAPDIGAGGDYWCRETHQYYRQVAAHNTVVVNGQGLDDRREMLLNIKAAEPRPREGEDVQTSKSCHRQYVEVESVYDAGSVKARQRRTVGIVRTGAKTGYYVDVFRSKVIEGEEKYHDYIYHNLGDWKIDEGAIAAEGGCLDPQSGRGYDYFTTLGVFKGDIHARFDYGNSVVMQSFVSCEKGRTAYALEGPRAFRHYNRRVGGKSCPAPLVRQQGEAWTRPFVAIHEPYGGGVSAKVAGMSVEHVKGIPNVIAVTVTFKDNPRRKDIILSADNEQACFTYNRIRFMTSFAVISYLGDKIINVYGGEGTTSWRR